MFRLGCDGHTASSRTSTFSSIRGAHIRRATPDIAGEEGLLVVLSALGGRRSLCRRGSRGIRFLRPRRRRRLHQVGRLGRL